MADSTGNAHSEAAIEGRQQTNTAGSTTDSSTLDKGNELNVFGQILSLSLFSGLFIYFVWSLFTIWADGPAKFYGHTLEQEQQYFLLVVFSGALGGTLYLLTSLTTYLGNKQLVMSWLPWYFLRPVIGAGLAIIFYVLLRGGLLSYPQNASSSNNNSEKDKKDKIAQTIPKQENAKDSAAFIQKVKDSLSKTIKDTAVINQKALAAYKAKTEKKTEGKNEEKQEDKQNKIPLNPFGILAISVLAGMFPRKAAQKLEAVFDSLFNTNKDEQMKDKLDEGKTDQQKK